ncbi:MAG: hypothetical protein K0R67_478 [Paenibacillus sp.]|nr:hypothetical protein [Paenibacillus sp.]
MKMEHGKKEKRCKSWLQRLAGFTTLVAGFTLLCGLGAILSSPPAVAANSPLLGVIRWDCFSNSTCADLNSLGPQQYHDRVPYFLSIDSSTQVSGNENSQSTIDQQIQYAHNAGIDYWAFVSGPDTSPNVAEAYALHKYLASAYKEDLDFSVIIHRYNAQQTWSQRVDQMVEWFEEPTYVKVLGNRPLVYIFNVADMETYYGSGTPTQTNIDLLRQKTVDAGLGDPYIVAMHWQLNTAVSQLNKYGLDAIGRYGYSGLNGSQDMNNPSPFSALAQAQADSWNDYANSGKPFVPDISTGWDKSPRTTTPPPWGGGGGPYYKQPTPGEIAGHFKAGMDFARNHTTAVEANTVLAFAWNEVCEGGWLVPTHAQGTERLDAIKAMLNGVGVNALRNPGFEADMDEAQSAKSWSTWGGSSGTHANADYTETGGYSWSWRLTHNKSAAYEVATHQTVTGLTNGLYTLTAWVQSSGGQTTAQMSVKDYGGVEVIRNITASSTWQQIQLQHVPVTNGQAKIVFYSNAGANQWIRVDDVSFFKETY